MDGHPLPEGLAVRLAPEVSSDEPEQAPQKEESVRRPRLGLPRSMEDAAALTQAEELCPSYLSVIAVHVGSGDKKRKKAVPTESITSVPLRQEAAPMSKTRPVPKLPVPTVRPAERRAHAPRSKHRQAKAVYNLQGMRPIVVQSSIRKYPLVSQMLQPVPEGLERTPLAVRTRKNPEVRIPVCAASWR